MHGGFPPVQVRLARQELAIRACQAGHRVAFATAADWVARLADAHHAGQFQAELTRPGRYPLIVVDEVGYIPFEPEAANLFFQLVSSRYERASLIVTSNKPTVTPERYVKAAARPGNQVLAHWYPDTAGARLAPDGRMRRVQARAVPGLVLTAARRPRARWSAVAECAARVIRRSP
jgi:hypothetical protein